MTPPVALKYGWYDWRYIANRPTPSTRKGDEGTIISSAAHLRAILHYDQYRPQEIVNDASDQVRLHHSQPVDNSGSRQEPESRLEAKLDYDQHRPDGDETAPRQFPKRAILDYGLGADPQQIMDNCKAWANPHVFAFHLVVSVHPRLAAILEAHGFDSQKFTETYTAAFSYAFFEGLDCGDDIQFSMVVHTKQTDEGLPHPHAHVTYPGTGYNAITQQRQPVPFITPEILADGQNIADRIAEQEMDRVLSRAWRLEVPELAATFYDPLELPIPEPSAELDTWFPRPKIPAAALAPLPDPIQWADAIFPPGIWETVTSFGEPDELAQLVDTLFTDLSFEIPADLPMATPMFGPDSTPVEPDEGETHSRDTALNTLPERIMADERGGELDRADPAENSAPVTSRSRLIQVRYPHATNPMNRSHWKRRSIIPGLKVCTQKQPTGMARQMKSRP